MFTSTKVSHQSVSAFVAWFFVLLSYPRAEFIIFFFYSWEQVELPTLSSMLNKPPLKKSKVGRHFFMGFYYSFENNTRCSLLVWIQLSLFFRFRELMCVYGFASVCNSPPCHLGEWHLPAAAWDKWECTGMYCEDDHHCAAAAAIQNSSVRTVSVMLIGQNGTRKEK